MAKKTKEVERKTITISKVTWKKLYFRKGEDDYDTYEEMLEDLLKKTEKRKV